MLENLSQQDKSKLTLDRVTLERAQQEQLTQNQEIIAEELKTKLDQNLQIIDSKIKEVTHIPDYQERQIIELGGDIAVVEEQLKPELNLLKTLRESTNSKFLKVVGVLGIVGSSFLSTEKPQMSDSDILVHELHELKNRDFIKSDNRVLSESNPLHGLNTFDVKYLNDLILMKEDPDRYVKEETENRIKDLLKSGNKINPNAIRQGVIDDMNFETQGGIDSRIEFVRSHIPIGYQEAFEKTDKQLAWMNKILKSPEYEKRALEYEKISESDIQDRVRRINRYDYNIEDDAEYNENHNDNFESLGLFYPDDNNYGSKSGKVFLRKGEIERKDYSTGIHEFTHQSTNGNTRMSEYAKNLYEKAFTDQNITPEEKQSKGPDFDYLKDYTELDARKKVMEYFMEQEGIKKYGEKFNQEHYQKLLKLQKEKKIPHNVDQFLRFIKPEYMEEIMNTIAENKQPETNTLGTINVT